MRSLIALDYTQLKRIQEAIAVLEARPAAEQIRKRHLLNALQQEEKELRRYCRCTNGQRQALAA
jgi:hypothetical protein